MPDNVAVVLAAGQGARMMSRLPKVLHRVCGREMIGLVVDTVRDAGFRPTVVVSKESDGVRSVLGDTVSYAVQDDQLGTGHALLQADGLLPFADNVLVINGDVPLLEPSTLTALAEEHSSQGAAATIATATLGDPGDLGRVVRDASGRVTAVVEKADADDVALGIREVNGQKEPSAAQGKSCVFAKGACPKHGGKGQVVAQDGYLGAQNIGTLWL